MAYMVYMGMLAVFCTNAINIYAGINGLEAGQVKEYRKLDKFGCIYIEGILRIQPQPGMGL